MAKMRGFIIRTTRQFVATGGRGVVGRGGGVAGGSAEGGGGGRANRERERRSIEKRK